MQRSTPIEPLGHSEDFAFYCKWDGNPLEDFKQKGNMTCLIS